MSTPELALVFAAGVVGSFYGVSVGGGSMVTIPALIFLGMPPHIAVATNRFAVLGVPFAGLAEYSRAGLVDVGVSLRIALFSVVGAVAGANLLMAASEAAVMRVTGILILVMLATALANPRLGIVERERRLSKLSWAGVYLGATLLGVYGGFFGAGVGGFLAYLLVAALGRTFLQATATAKPALAALTVSATTVFIAAGMVDYVVGSVLLVAMGLGSWVGARVSIRAGNRFLRWGYIAVVSAMGVTLLLSG